MLFRNRVQLFIRGSSGALMQKPEIPRSHPMASSNKWRCRLIQTSSAINKAAEPSSAQRGIMNVITERLGAIMTIGINRPQSRNAVNPQTASELLEAFRSFDEDPSLKAAVFYGVGGNFCAGYDLKEFAKNATRNPTMLPFEVDATKHPSPMGPARMQLSKPVIAAVSGYAVAGGLELTLLADLRVVEQSAIFGVFCRRFEKDITSAGVPMDLCYLVLFDKYAMADGYRILILPLFEMSIDNATRFHVLWLGAGSKALVF